MNKRIIWRYWEGNQPDYIKRLANQPQKFSNGEIIYLNNRTVGKYVQLPRKVFTLKTIAHRADIIRSALLHNYGGIWLDADIVVVKDIDFLFEDVEGDYSMVSYNEAAALSTQWRLRVGVLAAKKGCPVIGQWHQNQLHVLKNQYWYNWTTFGADALNKAALGLAEQFPIKVYNINTIEPIHWKNQQLFHDNLYPEDIITDETTMLSYHNSRQKTKIFGVNTLGGRLLDKYC
jgi:hypothetical protein